MKFKNFKRYEPIEKSFGESAIYLKSEEGQDWYSCQELFALDSLKIVYDQNGLIISQSRDVSSLFPIDASVAEINTKLTDVLGLYFLKGQLIETPKPSEHHQWDGKAWVIPKEKKAALLTEQREHVFAQIVTKRDECVNGGAYVERIGKWVDSDEKGRATLVEIKADFDLNGKDNTYTLICSDNTAYTLNFDEFKSVWDAVKTLKEKMFENAYMHQILLEQAENPLEYDWSIGWSKTYQQHLAEKGDE